MYKKTGAALMACALIWAHAQTAPYAGQQDRAIKSLPPDEVAALLKGEGMGLAKAAELNGYPGPAHVLEHAQALSLSAAQHDASQALLDRHKGRARDLGAQLVAAEQALDQSFALRRVDGASLAELTARIGGLQAQLRAEHLRTHLEQTALLSGAQVQQYNAVRGYTATSAAPVPAPHRKHH